MDKTTTGWLSGFLGVLIFSGSLPATRVAVADFDPVFLTAARGTIAGLIALALLAALRERLRIGTTLCRSSSSRLALWSAFRC